jgi:hypothetical protein
MIVPFKRALYEAVLAAFDQVLRQHAGPKP